MAHIFSFLAEHFDLPILDWIAARLWCPALDAVMPPISFLGDAGLIWILFAAAMLFFPKYRKTGIAMGMALLMGLLLCNITLKPLVARPRPFDYQLIHFGKEIPLLIARPTDFSFPSGHTIASFEAAVVITLRHKKLGTPALILASLIAFSRLYLYVHYPTDVLFSVIFGTGIAFFANWAVNRLLKNSNI